MKQSVLIVLGLLLLPHWAAAGDVAPGLWELSLEASVESAPGFAPGPMAVNQCFSKADAADPAKFLAAVETTAAGDCTFTDRTYVGDTFRFRMVCEGTLHLQTSGEITFSATTLNGVVLTSAALDGKAVEFKSVLRGRRLGDC